MTSRQSEVNLAHLSHTYFIDNPSVTRAARDRISAITDGRRDEKVDRALEWTLRHHDETGAIHWTETYIRDGFDYLLSYYGLIEISTLIGLVPNPLPKEQRDIALQQLSHPAVKRYYEKNYPVLLPRLLRLRLEGRWKKRIRPSKQTTALFILFLEISRPVDFDKNVETFLWFLDDGLRSGYDIDDVNEALRSSTDFVRHSSKTRRPSALDRGVQGMTEYLGLLGELHALLESTDDRLLRSAFWHWHGYWLGGLRHQMSGNLTKAITHVARWSMRDRAGPETDEDKDLYDAAHKSQQKMLAVVRQLTSHTYGKPLIEAAAGI
jgi:hypothetical protein